jgi:O-antigen/teichoic acid export membrane protein
MRLEQTIKNIKYTTISYMLNNILKFIVRMIFVQALPIEYLGINGLFSNIITVLSLAELGVGPAIVYSLYGPLAQKDKETVKSLMYMFKKAYLRIGLFIIIAGLCVTPWLDWFIKGDSNIPDLQWFYVIFLLNTGVSYFYAYKRNLLIADQKQYVSTVNECSWQIIMSIAQIFALKICPSFWPYTLLILAATVGENFTIARKADKAYPLLLETDIKPLGTVVKHTVFKNVSAIIFHKVGDIVVFSTANVILAKFIGLAAVGLYSNYYLIINAINNFTWHLFSAITASVGNLVAVEKIEKKQKIFKIIEQLTGWFAAVLSVGMYMMLNPLIELWLGKEYLFSETLLIWIIVSFYLSYMRKAVCMFKDASGLFWNDRYKPLAESVINIIASVYLTIHYGIIGVVWGGIISTVAAPLWVEPYVLFGNELHLSLKYYFGRCIQYAVVTIAAAVLGKYMYTILFPQVTFTGFIIGCMISLIVSNLLWWIVFGRTREFKYMKKLLTDKISKYNSKKDENQND